MNNRDEGMGIQEESKGHIAALITVSIWGLTYVSTKSLLDYYSPIEILVIRFVIGYATLWLLCPHILQISDKKQYWYFAAAGLCGVTLYYLFENIALTYTLATNVGVLIAVAPFFTAIFSCLFMKAKRPGFYFYIGFVIAIIGVFLISFSGESELQLNPLGDVLAIIAAIVWAAYATLTKKIANYGYDTIKSTRLTFFFGLMFMIPAACLMDFNPDFSSMADAGVLSNILFLGLGASALCFVTWNLAVKVLGSIKTSVYIYLMPVITAISSAIILSEKITAVMAFGVVLTLAGLILSEYRKSEKTKLEKGTKDHS